MSKQHECEWYMCANPAGEIYAMCRDIRCHGKVLKRDEIESRLNATERLSAEDARYYGELSGITLIRDAMIAYADTLEGKCATG